MERERNRSLLSIAILHVISALLVTFTNYISWEYQDITTGFYKAHRVSLFKPERVPEYSSYIIILAIILHCIAALIAIWVNRSLRPNPVKYALIIETAIIGFALLTYAIFYYEAAKTESRNGSEIWMDTGIVATLISSTFGWFFFKKLQYTRSVSEKLRDENDDKTFIQLLRSFGIASFGLFLTVFNNYISFDTEENGDNKSHRIRILQSERAPDYAQTMLIVILIMMVCNVIILYIALEKRTSYTANIAKYGLIATIAVILNSAIVLAIPQFTEYKVVLDFGFYVALLACLLSFIDISGIKWQNSVEI